MNWFDWVLVVVLAIGAISTITMIDKPRVPITHEVAVITLIIQTALIVGVVLTRT